MKPLNKSNDDIDIIEEIPVKNISLGKQRQFVTLVESMDRSDEESDILALDASDLNLTNESCSSIEEVVLDDDNDDDDEIEYLGEEIVKRKKNVRSSSKRVQSLPPPVTKCNNCRQQQKTPFKPQSGASLRKIITDETVNILMDIEDDEDEAPLQYKMTDFTVYCKEGRESHLVPIFAENLISNGRDIYLAGKVLRLDSQEGEEGLQAVDIGPITMWSNATGMNVDQENVIISAECDGKYVEFNLLRPSSHYLAMFKTIYRQVYLANRIITALVELEGRWLEYSELLEFVSHLAAPALYGEKLPPCDEEFLQLHADFVVSQVRTFDEAGEEDNEELTLGGQPCIKHLAAMSGLDRRGTRSSKPSNKAKGITPQPATLNTKSQTTVLVAELFDSIFQSQMKQNRAARNKMCACRACQRNNCGLCERCKEMISFGGKTPDRELLCLERQCLKKMDMEVTLGDDEDNISITKSLKAGVKYEGVGKSDGSSDRVYYDSALLRLPGGRREVTVSPGSYLLVTPDQEEHKLGVPHYPCRVLYFLTRKVRGQTYQLAHVQWLARTENTILGRTGDTREWFMVEECEDIDLTSVSKVLDIQQVKVTDFGEWRRLGGTRGAIIKQDVGGADGFWRQKYQPEFGRFVAPSEEETRLRGAGECLLCQRRKEKLEAEKLEVSQDGREVRINGTWYGVGQFMMLTDNSITYTIPRKEPKVYPKETNVDPKMYPEHWRKPDVYEGDHHDTWDPFQVVRLEEIVKDGPHVYIRVRKLYRPEDTHLNNEEARAQPLTALYWSNEIARIHDVEFAVRNKKISMEEVVGPCHVTTVQNDEEETIAWTDGGEDRFFISSCYDAVKRQFSPLSPSIVATIGARLASHPAPELPPVEPLKTLDIFAGCGGLSHGLGQAGVVRHSWAVEFWSPSANAYKKNNPECQVFNEECNGLLKQAMEGDTQSAMPRKGDVDMIVGGPPCQGFSLLNIYKESEYSKFKNSLIPTFLSYCDFYRPKYFILENVRNLVANENGMVLKLILATLVKMGYQVGFNILQAGHYGVAQTRRRLIVTAAAPGQRLPLDPEPVYNFCGTHFLEVDIDGRRYTTTTSRPGAPRRGLTVWDTISDLPPISSGHDRDLISYGGPPRSHLQRMFRHSKQEEVRDHITKEVNSLAQERINHIPTTPGSDWRDLPNKATRLEDGRAIQKLHYAYQMEDGTSRICSCSVSGECDQDDKQTDTFMPWAFPHTADRHNHWKEVMGRAPWDGIFKTTITDPEPLGKQGQVLHPEQDRLLSVREFARSQGFPDSFQFSGTIRDRHREIGNAVPPPLGRALGLEIRKAIVLNQDQDKTGAS